MTKHSQPIPTGYCSVTPSLTFKDSSKALEFYVKAFGAEIVDHLPSPSGNGTMHATMRIGDSIIMMGDEMPGSECGKSAETLGASPISLYLYVENVDGAFQQALTAGASAVMPVTDMFWGDRCGTLRDPFGYMWMVATHIQDLTKEQIQTGAKEFMASMGM